MLALIKMLTAQDFSTYLGISSYRSNVLRVRAHIARPVVFRCLPCGFRGTGQLPVLRSLRPFSRTYWGISSSYIYNSLIYSLPSPQTSATFRGESRLFY